MSELRDAIRQRISDYMLEHQDNTDLSIRDTISVIMAELTPLIEAAEAMRVYAHRMDSDAWDDAVAALVKGNE